MGEEGNSRVGERSRVFLSYSRSDLAVADQLVRALADRGFEPLFDRQDIDSGENWKERLGALIRSCDVCVFVLTETSASSAVCNWEVEEAARLGKRIVPALPRALTNVEPPVSVSALNYVLLYSDAASPGSGFYDGLVRLTTVLGSDREWHRRQTRLSEQAAVWARSTDGKQDHLLRGTALEEAVAWSKNVPSGNSVPQDVAEYLHSSEFQEESDRIGRLKEISELELAIAKLKLSVAEANHKAADAAVGEHEAKVAALRVNRRVKFLWFSVVLLLLCLVAAVAVLLTGWRLDAIPR